MKNSLLSLRLLLAVSFVGMVPQSEAAQVLGDPAWTAEVDQNQAEFGNSVSGAGDVNGDGFQDVIVGSHLFDNGQEDEGGAFLYLGSADGPSLAPDWTAESNQISAMFGFSVSGAGDVNGDGFDDVIVGSYCPETDHALAGGGEAVWVYLGTADATAIGSPAYSFAHPEPTGSESGFGCRIALLGDLDGNGVDEVAISDPFQDTPDVNGGKVYLFDASGIGDAAAVVIDPSVVTSGEFGISLTGW